MSTCIVCGASTRNGQAIPAAPSPALTRDRDELRKAVEALPTFETEVTTSGTSWADATWGSVTTVELDAVLALLSAGDEAEAPPR